VCCIFCTFFCCEYRGGRRGLEVGVEERSWEVVVGGVGGGGGVRVGGMVVMICILNMDCMDL